MIFWFIGTAIVAVGYIFRDPAFDYRLLVAGSLLPLFDVVTGGVGPLHSLTVSIALLGLIMLTTRRGGSTRRLLLGLPIGMLMHLVFDGAWTDTEVFWWPFTGLELPDGSLPLADRGVLSLFLEAVGIGLCIWVVRRNGLTTRARWRSFWRDGRLLIAS